MERFLKDARVNRFTSREDPRAAKESLKDYMKGFLNELDKIEQELEEDINLIDDIRGTNKHEITQDLKITKKEKKKNKKIEEFKNDAEDQIQQALSKAKKTIEVNTLVQNEEEMRIAKKIEKEIPEDAYEEFEYEPEGLFPKLPKPKSKNEKMKDVKNAYGLTNRDLKRRKRRAPSAKKRKSSSRMSSKMEENARRTPKPSESKYTFRGMKRKSMHKNPDKLTSDRSDLKGVKGKSRSSLQSGKKPPRRDQPASRERGSGKKRSRVRRGGSKNFIAMNKRNLSKGRKSSRGRGRNRGGSGARKPEWQSVEIPSYAQNEIDARNDELEAQREMKIKQYQQGLREIEEPKAKEEPREEIVDEKKKEFNVVNKNPVFSDAIMNTFRVMKTRKRDSGALNQSQNLDKINVLSRMNNTVRKKISEYMAVKKIQAKRQNLRKVRLNFLSKFSAHMMVVKRYYDEGFDYTQFEDEEEEEDFIKKNLVPLKFNFNLDNRSSNQSLEISETLQILKNGKENHIWDTKSIKKDPKGFFNRILSLEKEGYFDLDSDRFDEIVADLEEEYPTIVQVEDLYSLWYWSEMFISYYKALKLKKKSIQKLIFKSAQITDPSHLYHIYGLLNSQADLGLDPIQSHEDKLKVQIPKFYNVSRNQISKEFQIFASKIGKYKLASLTSKKLLEVESMKNSYFSIIDKTLCNACYQYFNHVLDEIESKGAAKAMKSVKNLMKLVNEIDGLVERASKKHIIFHTNFAD